jgi:MerR family transcriptional regulator, thiopeptide resistance regulator
MTDTELLTVKRLASLAGVTPRTLRYYDRIGLLKPDSVGANGYRHYGKEAILKLQQILFYRELDMPLEEIRDLITRPDFDVVHALQAHRASLQERSNRLGTLIRTIDGTVNYLEGKQDMNNEEFFEGWTEEKQPQFEQEIRQKYGEHAMDEVIDWNSYTKVKKAIIMAEGEANMQSMAFLMYLPPNSLEVQEAVARWHQHMKYFYDPSIERMRGLGQMYVDDPRFNTMYEKVRKGLALFMKQAINVYCDGLEGK